MGHIAFVDAARATQVYDCAPGGHILKSISSHYWVCVVTGHQEVQLKHVTGGTYSLA